MSGVQCVMMDGVLLMPWWFADNLDMNLMVTSALYLSSCHTNYHKYNKIILYHYYYNIIMPFSNAGAIPYYYGHFGQGVGDIFLAHVSCSGSEQRLVDCSFTYAPTSGCYHYEDAGVRCPGIYAGTAAAAPILYADC